MISKYSSQYGNQIQRREIERQSLNGRDRAFGVLFPPSSQKKPSAGCPSRSLSPLLMSIALRRVRSATRQLKLPECVHDAANSSGAAPSTFIRREDKLGTDVSGI
jgi:hypothetical protein